MTKKMGLTDRSIDVEADDKSGRLEWTIDSVKPKDSKLELKKDSGAHRIEFRFKNHTKDDALRFNCARPFQVGEDCDCPPMTGINSDQIEVMACSADTLTVIDHNYGRERVLIYQLNFIDGDGGKHGVDPEIKNGGGVRTN